jgi:hypothetical protein
MEPLLDERIRDFRSLSGYFVSLGFTDMLYLPKRPIAKAFANASWQQQRRAIENILSLRRVGWKGIDLEPHSDAVTQAEKVAVKCLKKGRLAARSYRGRTRLYAGRGFSSTSRAARRSVAHSNAAFCMPNYK